MKLIVHLFLRIFPLIAIVSMADPTCQSGSSPQVKVGHDSQSPNLRIILIRHGESENNIHHEISMEQYQQNRQADPDLTPVGYQQAQETAEYLRMGTNALLRNVHEIYVSPVRRTLLTCRPIAHALQIKPQVWADLFEVGGVYTKDPKSADVDGVIGTVGLGGLTRSQMSTEFPNYILDDRVSDKGWYTLSTKETKEQGRARIERVLQTLRNQVKTAAEDRTVLLVVHGDFIDFFVQAAFDIPGTTRTFPCWNTCITIVDLDATGRAMVLQHNSVSHLSIVKTESLGKC
jgi:broad specificity phosphatase PhoE